MNTESTSPETMPGDEMDPSPTRPERTGRVLVLFKPGESRQGAEVLRTANIQLSATGGAGNGQANRLYSELDVAVITPDRNQSRMISAASAEAGSPILTTAVETRVEVKPIQALQEPEATATWGLEATNVINSSFSGEGIRVAILDTGFDLTHPDFEGRKIIHESFVDEAVQDGHGHGTHCTGTACGSRNPGNVARYGVAYGADIYIGKVLGNNGSGVDGSIIDGINWAVQQGCHIISMSLGGLVLDGEEYSSIYEEIAGRALTKGTLIIAAAGNHSLRDRRPSIINPVSNPADCPSILAVGAIDKSYAIASFSNGEKSFRNAGKVDIVGPGVNVYSSWPMSRRYNTISGTSMATPHVAGIAALYAQAEKMRGQEVRGRDLWNLLIKRAKPLTGLDQRDVGAGLIQAP